MKIFIYSTHNLWPSHPETELEIIQQHLDKGDEVTRFTCKGELPICDANVRHSIDACLQCTDIGKFGKKLLNGTIKELPVIRQQKSVTEKVASINLSYTSLEEIRNMRVDNFDLGYAVLSSLIFLLRDPAPGIASHREKINHFLTSSLGVYYSALEYIKELSPDAIYIFNGRLAHVKPILRAAQMSQTTCYIHERGYNKFHYELFKNTTPHDRNYILARMYELWNSADPLERNKIGDSFFKERVAGEEQGWYSFTKEHQRGLLPGDWDSRKRNIAIFNSSEDEFASIGPEWKNELYETQTAGIKRIVADCMKYPGLHFYLRMHPNLIGVNNADKDELENLSSPNLTIINAESKVSSYDLLFNCEKVIAFGSSVGIEAVYWDKPSIQAGKSYYFDMDVTYKPSTHSELISMTVDHLTPKEKTGALIYGYYFKTFGRPFTIYKPAELRVGEYNGVDLSSVVSGRTRFFNSLGIKPILRKIPAWVSKDYEGNKKKLKDYFL